MSEAFLDFIAASPSSYHAAHEVGRRLRAAGFTQQDEATAWSATPGGHFLIRGGAVLAWWVPDAQPDAFRIIGSHTDSPGFKLKPRGDLSSAAFQQAGVEVYGGPIIASWLDRELALAGRIVLRDGSTRNVATAGDFRIPHLAIHLDRSINEDLKLDRQAHTQPIFAVGHPDTSVLDVVAAAAGVDKNDILSHDLITVDAQRGALFGVDKQLIAAGRMDNLSSVYASLEAFLAATTSASDVLVLAAFDHEEIGSASTTGAAGPILEDVLSRTAAALGAGFEESKQMYARSTCVSADAAHSLHPNFVSRHDPVNYPLLAQGPVAKVNANQRYATNALTHALWEQACVAASVPSQVFAGNNNSPCGSTIGPITATRLGIDTVDVGIPLLSMHSARELAHVQDMAWLEQALLSYLTLSR
ncbi:M18 family aminopeptidase [Corynebacterium sp. H128]|uniref:M18 family aminopeptidase n=1 Tax=Corynebacterium sp. H128 TaxID=3133427 RepID=UPI0030A7F52F